MKQSKKIDSIILQQTHRSSLIGKLQKNIRDGGKFGDDVLTRILNGLPDYWNDGGYAQIVTFLHEFEARSQLDEIRVFAKSHQLETSVLRVQSRDKFDLATTRYAE